MSHPTITLALLDALQEKWHQRFMALSAKDSEKRVGRAVSEAADDLGDIVEVYESERLASDEPSPADDLPGEPVEPGDLRAGDRVSFTWRSERTTCNLVEGPLADVLYPDTPCSSGYSPSVAYHGREWAFGVTDVRLIERAPREDEDVDRDEVLAVFTEERAEFLQHEGVVYTRLVGPWEPVGGEQS